MRLLALSALLIFVADQVSKIYVVQYLGLRERVAIDVLPPFLNFRMAWNQGVNFGLFANDANLVRWILIAVALAVSLGLVIWLRRGTHRARVWISGGILVGGALGNVVDRIVYGAVADFLNMSCCGLYNPFSFNIADIAIFAGAAGLVLFAEDKKTS